jgi:hypothetical protein
MALNAHIFCDCFKEGRLRVPPPFPDRIFLDDQGEVTWRGPSTLEEDLEFDDWRFNKACPHSGFVLLEHRLGNIWGIQWIRETLQQISKDPAAEFPVLRLKVVHSGSHSGSHLTQEEVRVLGGELNRLREAELGELRLSKENPLPARAVVHPPATAEDLAFVRGVFSKLEELVALSLKLGRPIAF